MRTAVPGRGRAGEAYRRAACSRAHERGFTLMELLVVMLVIGIVLAAVQLQLFDDTSRKLRQEGERLAALLATLQTEAMTRGERLGVSLAADGYTVARQDADAATWQPAVAEVFRPYRLPDGMRIAAVEVEGRRVQPGGRLIFPPSGLVSPFRIELAAAEHRLRLTGDAMGRIRIE